MNPGLQFVLHQADIIWNLIERKQLIEAVRLICTFKLNDKFPPVPLLIEFVEDAKKCCSEIFSKVKSHDEKVPQLFF